MSKRALILWVCFGTLFLSAAKVTTVVPSQMGEVAGVFPASANNSGETADFDRLRAAYGPSLPMVKNPELPSGKIKESTLWLARAIYSETKLPHEQELVAWVIRNRVETGFRGRTTYEAVVLDPYQFSAFNPGSTKRSFYMSLTPGVQLPAWQQALWIAHYVRHANPVYRPFSIETRHFYSERSMGDRQHPYWANRHQFVTPGWDYQVNERRFRFYKEIS